MDKRGFMRKSAEAIAYYKLAGFEASNQGVEITHRNVSITLKVYRARKSGDLDNRIKPLLDALQGVAFYDDKQVIEIHAFRFDDKHNPRVEVTIELRR
jgi:Holliday junction resolvase RusA-like endonuclease